MRLVNQNWWFTTLLVSKHTYCPPLDKHIKCDVAIVGGGFAGCVRRGAVPPQGPQSGPIDKNIIGGSSSGRSAGFLTPDSELELHQLCRRYGNQAAREIWDAPLRGIEVIVNAIKRYDIKCGLLEQDSLFLGLGKDGFEAAKSELECRESVGFTDQKLYDVEQLKAILGSRGLYRRHSLRRHLRDQSVAMPAGVQGHPHRRRHADLREHGDGAARGPHGPYPRRQHHRRQHHHRRRQAGELHQPAGGRGVSCTDLPQRQRAADRRRTPHPVSVGRADAVLGFQAGLHVFPPDGRQSPAARRRLGAHYLPQGCVQQPRHHPACHQRLLRALPAAQESEVHPVLAGADRYDARPAADHRAAEGPAAHAFHFRLRGNSLGHVHRQLRGAQRAGRRRRRLRRAGHQDHRQRAHRQADGRQPGPRGERDHERDRELDAAADRLFAEVLAVASGKQTAAERLGHREFAIHRRNPTI